MPYKNNFTIDQVRQFWDSVANIYDDTNANVQDLHDQRYKKAVQLISPVLENVPSKILNVWARTGRGFKYLNIAFPNGKIENLEPSEKMRSIAIKNFPDVEFKSTDLQDLPYIDNYFDLVVSLETLEHCPSPFIFLKEIARVLKKGGKAIISVPPPSAEIVLVIYELFADNHGEGPHKFLSYRTVSCLISDVGLKLINHYATLFLPFNSKFAKKVNEYIEANFKYFFLRNHGLRHFYVVEKPM